MKQVLHFNKVIKFVIIFGDLCLLNIIFISLYHIFDYQTLGNEFTHSLPQLLVLLNLVYLLCNYSNGVILHERIVRPERIVRRAIPYLGQPKEVVTYLQQHHIEQVYCCLPSARSHEIVPIINYCENHLIRFYSVPNIRNYLHRRMHFELFGNIPVLTIREEPLTQMENRLLKRAFDLFFSLSFLCTVFPFVYIIIGTTIKLSSSGPIFFKQKRSGENGKEFWCYQFRSMRVNIDSDKLQATANDPRKTKIGDFIRKTGIDELPQFINVLLGQMSVVGPRPHMLKHTEEYSHLIDKYMVRHLVKPGITGWAQVTGYRGETKELWQMEGRVQRDVWYLEHWTFLLDLYIIYKTVRNAVRGEKEAYQNKKMRIKIKKT